jgi:transposase InsO family protein
LEPKPKKKQPEPIRPPVITPEDQLEDPEIVKMYRFLEDGTLPPHVGEQNTILRVKNEYILRDGLVHRLWIDLANRRRLDSMTRLVWVPEKHRNSILKCYHDSPCGGGHFGFDKTYARIRKRYFWTSITTDIEDFCKTCDVCQRRNAVIRSRPEMQLPEVPETRWHTVGMDIAGPFPVTTAGNKYLLVIIDHLTRWPEAFAMPDQHADTVLWTFVNKFVSRWGVPYKVVTDQGSNFTSEMALRLYAHLGMKRASTTPYHPQSNGMVERLNRTLKASISKIQAVHDCDWDLVLDWALGNIRAMPSSATNETPYFLVCGQDVRMPSEALANDVIPDFHDSLHPVRRPKYFLHAMKSIAKIARMQSLKTQRTTKRAYDKKSRNPRIKPGDWVKLVEKVRKPGQKLKHRFTGPYKVTSYSPLSRFAIRIKLEDGALRTVNIANVARWFTRSAPKQ